MAGFCHLVLPCGGAQASGLFCCCTLNNTGCNPTGATAWRFLIMAQWTVTTNLTLLAFLSDSELHQSRISNQNFFYEYLFYYDIFFNWLTTCLGPMRFFLLLKLRKKICKANCWKHLMISLSNCTGDQI